MNILVAPDKFKGSLTAMEVCRAVEAGVKKFSSEIQVRSVPLADGGEGTLSALASNMVLQKKSVTVADPLFRPVTAEYMIGKNTAYIEMASASGLELLQPAERNCLYTTTFGTGQLIKDAIQNGATEIYLFIGGSATNDAGIGMAAALGYSFVDQHGTPLKPIGENLVKIDDYFIEDSGMDVEAITFYVACDVQNTLSGPQGAAWVYAAQKGADEAAIKLLDTGLEKLGKLMHKKVGVDIVNQKASGAAGGLGAGAMVFLGAYVKSGIQTVMEIVDLEKFVKEADFVISGEGKFDRQTLAGKVVAGVGSLTIKHNKPLGIICGIKDSHITSIDLQRLGITKLLTLTGDDISSDYAIKNAFELVTDNSKKLVTDFFGN